MSDASTIHVENLKKTYRDGFLGRKRVEALKGVSFSVPQGEIFGLLGPNGAGKTTLIKVLLGIVRKSEGDATLLGHPAGALQSRKRVGYLPESHRIPRHHTANSALFYYGRLSGLSTSDIKAKKDDLLKMVGLEGWGSTPVRKFSKGMQQRLGLAQAMLHDPDLLILDEPTDGVDPVGRSDIRSVLQVLKNRGKTIFLNSHLLQEIELVCDQVVVLYKGQVRKQASVKELTQASADLTLRLVGSSDAISAALEGTSILSRETLDESELVVVDLSQQADIDALVDRIRANQVSIGDLTRKKRTLEEAFLNIVGDDPNRGGVQ